MMNDLPDDLCDIETSLFADDSAIYKSGRNVRHLQKVMQKNLEKIQEWCDNWGFRISADKTVAVLFTYSRDTVKLTINGKEIKTAKTAKFLGMLFDQKLTRCEHIDQVVKRSKKTSKSDESCIR